MALEALALVCQNKEIFLFVRRELVRGLPHLEFKLDEGYELCQNREVEGASHKSKDMINITEPLQMIRMEFYGSANVMSANKARYLFVMIIDYSRFFRVVRMCSKDKTSQIEVDQDEP